MFGRYWENTVRRARRPGPVRRFLNSVILPLLIVFGAAAEFGVSSPVSATALGLGRNSTQKQFTRPNELSALQLAVRALAATCVRFPKGQGLPEAVAPGSPLSLPPLPPQAARQLSSAVGAIGWRLPRSLGVAVLVLRPDGTCSILIQNIDPKGLEAAIREVFKMIPPLRLKILEANTCVVDGLPMTTRMYAMIPTNNLQKWGTPEIADGKTTWRGFLLSVAVRRDAADRHQVAMTTFVGRHDIGMSCDPEKTGEGDPPKPELE